jgi:hypothetical protein
MGPQGIRFELGMDVGKSRKRAWKRGKKYCGSELVALETSVYDCWGN